MSKLIKKSFHRKDSGFTLIELLIVIVIIGILAGVLIAVINPVRQQNRSRNAAVRASVLKAAFAINTVRAGIGILPSDSQVVIELENTTLIDDLGDDADLDGYFTISGTQMPNVCAGAGVYPQDGTSGPCYMHILSSGSDLLSGQFRIAAAKFYLDPSAGNRIDQIYLFDSNRGLLLCGDNVEATYMNVDADLSSCVAVETGDE